MALKNPPPQQAPASSAQQQQANYLMHEEVVDSRQLFLDSESHCQYTNSNTVMFDLGDNFRVNNNEYIRLNVSHIFGPRSWYQINQSNRYFYVFADTEDAQYIVRYAMDVGDVMNEHAMADNFIDALKFGKIDEAYGVNKFRIHWSNESNNTKPPQQKDTSLYKRQLNVSLDDFGIEINDSQVHKFYSFAGDINGNTNLSKGTLQHFRIYFPVNPEWRKTVEFQDTYKLLGGQKEKQVDLEEIYRQNNDTGRLQSRISLPQDVDLQVNLNNQNRLKNVVFKDNASGELIGDSGKDFQENNKELEIDPDLNYTFHFDTFQGRTFFAGFVSTSSVNDGIELLRGASNIPTQSNTNMNFVKVSEAATLWHPQGNSGAHTITINGSDLKNSRLVVTGFPIQTQVSIKKSNNPQKEQKDLINAIELTDFQSRVEAQPVLFANRQKDVAIDRQYNIATELVNVREYGSYYEAPYIHDRANSAIEELWEGNDGTIYKGGLPILDGLEIQRSNNDVDILGYAPMFITPEPFVYLRVSGGDNVASPHYHVGRTSSQDHHATKTDIMARAALQEDVFNYSSHENSASNATGYFVKYRGLNGIRTLEVSLTDSVGRNPLLGQSSLENGTAKLNLVIRVDRIRINRPPGSSAQSNWNTGGGLIWYSEFNGNKFHC